MYPSGQGELIAVLVLADVGGRRGTEVAEAKSLETRRSLRRSDIVKAPVVCLALAGSPGNQCTGPIARRD
jgi:hypothetical protein